MRGSHDGYSPKIVIVISEALVLQHGRLAKNTCTYHQGIEGKSS
ncbi:hypothetical protein SeV_B0357 [Salmonella enterica subsp. enterica serovar Virchow str. SL491]|uniref:Uncharacterized protein n=1 Tax=Salmonella virchow (strain SL491) TaxID=465517 RepID=A0A6C8F6Z3_SALV4|nr:hypothetical protein SeV_B0357 [Salmonella enterica subsp. enterica serovar Virchow str. SL491]